MNSITFCIPYYGKEPVHMDLLRTSITQLTSFYPENPILICKTSDSHMPDLTSYPTVKVYDTFVDGSHIIGAIELLIRKCDTTRFLIVHDSMFLLKALPPNILDRPFYSLWHFNEESSSFYNGDHAPFMNYFKISEEERLRMDMGFRSNPDRQWNAIFGPAFGGTMETLRIMWSILDINEQNVAPYLGRHGLMASERVIAFVCIYMGFNTAHSLNGNIYQHPNVFTVSSIPDFSKVVYPHSYFYKIWIRR